MLDPNQTSYHLLTHNSEAFFRKDQFSGLPKTNRIEALVSRKLATPEDIVEKAKNTYPLMHLKVKQLIEDFLAYKKKHGTMVEKELYKNMLWSGNFIERLLVKRPLMFMTCSDQAILRDGKSVTGGFENIGTFQEKPPLILEDYLSYDEMQIAALLGVSVPTHFINKGGRCNQAVPAEPGSYEKEGVYVGLVGARFEKPGKMEYQHMWITPDQNTKENGYGLNNNSDKAQALVPFAKFYGQTHFPTYEEAAQDKSGKFIKIGNNYLHKEVYKERIRVVVEPFLADANERARIKGKKAYAHMVGLGLGVWAKESKIQAELVFEVYNELLQENEYTYISDLDFSYFPSESKAAFDNIKAKNIAMHFSKRDPAEPLNDPHKLLVAQYAWDGNSYPGNEYYGGRLAASGDPAAACCSIISELQNPGINAAAFIAATERMKTYGKKEVKKTITDNTIKYTSGEEKIFILTPDIEEALYMAVPVDKQDALACEVNGSYPEKMIKTLKWLGIQVNEVSYNGNQGYCLKINQENINKIKTICNAPKASIRKPADGEAQEKPSFEQWLSRKHGVAAKSENTQKSGNIRQGAYINYVFNSLEEASNFAKTFGILVHTSRHQFEEIEQQLIFKDPLNPGKFALLIDNDRHILIKKKYHHEIEKSEYKKRSVDVIDAQIVAIDARLQLLEQQSMLADRLNKLHKLVTNTADEGLSDFETSSAFHISLQNFIALNSDILSKNELEALQEASRKIMGDKGEVSTGLKQDENWLDYTINGGLFPNITVIQTPFRTDARYLLNGVGNRIIIDSKTPDLRSLTSDDLEISDISNIKTRKVPRFLPSGDGKSETDEILIISGGMQDHRTITKIWKQENPHAPRGYDYFQTEYNAGADSEWRQGSLFNPQTLDYTTGVSWVVSTRKIKFDHPDDINKTLERLLLAQRMIMLFKKPRPVWDVEKHLKGYSEPNSDEAKAWSAWKARIDDCLESRDESMSKTGAPQLSGNCSVMSLKVFSDDYCENKIGTQKISEEHWRHIKANNLDSTLAALKEKKQMLETERAAAVAAAVPEKTVRLRPNPAAGKRTSQIAVKGIVIDAGSIDKYWNSLQDLMTKAEQQKIPVIFLCGNDDHKGSMSDWLQKSAFAWVKAETPVSLTGCLSQLQLSLCDCLNLSAGSGMGYDATQSTIPYVLLAPETDFNVFLLPGYQLPKKTEVQPEVTEAKPLAQVSQIVPENVLVLHVLLITNNLENATLISLLQNIAQAKTKIVLIGNEVPAALQAKLPNILSEAISLENLKNNKNQYPRDKTYCFMPDFTQVLTITKLRDFGFQCQSIQLSQTQNDFVNQLQSCYQTKLAKPTSHSRNKSKVVEVKKIWASNNNPTLFALESGVPARKIPPVTVELPQLSPLSPVQVPQSTHGSIKGIIIDPKVFHDVDNYHQRLCTLMQQAHEKNIPVILLFYDHYQYKSEMTPWLQKAGFDWVITKTAKELPGYLSQISLNAADCLNLSKGEDAVFNDTKDIIPYQMLTPDTNFDLFLSPDYLLPKKTRVQPRPQTSIAQVPQSAPIAVKGIVIEDSAFAMLKR